MIWSSEDVQAYRIGSAIKSVCVALGGWMDWSSNGEVRFLCRGKDGSVGVNFPDWVIHGMKENRDKIRRYVELVREEQAEYKRRDAELKASPICSGLHPRG